MHASPLLQDKVVVLNKKGQQVSTDSMIFGIESDLTGKLIANSKMLVAQIGALRIPSPGSMKLGGSVVWLSETNGRSYFQTPSDRFQKSVKSLFWEKHPLRSRDDSFFCGTIDSNLLGWLLKIYYESLFLIT